jgi:hypothetical protein
MCGWVSAARQVKINNIFLLLLCTLTLNHHTPITSTHTHTQDRHEAAKLHAREKQKQDQEKLKQQIVNRFADVVTIHDGGTSSSTGSNNNKKSQGLGAPVFAKGEESKVRFRDGQPVAFKGEKYLVEDLTPAWDGGSRGRVKTKGKRGPGFV